MRGVDKLEYIWSKIIGFVRDLDITSHEGHLEEMKIVILEKDDSRKIYRLKLFEGLLSERLNRCYLVSTSRLKSGVVF